MAWHSLLAFAPLAIMLALAAIQDLVRGRIANWLTLVLALTGLVQSFLPGATVAPLQSVLGLATGMGLTLGLFILGALGGGDVKLLTAAGAWLGPWLVLQVFLAAAIAGMILVLIQAACTGRLRLLAVNTFKTIVNLLHVRQLGLAHACSTGRSCRSIDKPLPYALPVLVATLGLLLWGRAVL